MSRFSCASIPCAGLSLCPHAAPHNPCLPTCTAPALFVDRAVVYFILALAQADHALPRENMAVSGNARGIARVEGVDPPRHRPIDGFAVGDAQEVVWFVWREESPCKHRTIMASR